MSGLGELDRPGTPGSAEAWDARSEEWLEGREESEVEAGAQGVAPGELSAVGQHGSDDVRGAGPVTKLRRVRGGTPVMCVPRGTSTKPCWPPAKTPVKGGPP